MFVKSLINMKYYRSSGCPSTAHHCSPPGPPPMIHSNSFFLMLYYINLNFQLIHQHHSHCLVGLLVRKSVIHSENYLEMFQGLSLSYVLHSDFVFENSGQCSFEEFITRLTQKSNWWWLKAGAAGEVRRADQRICRRKLENIGRTKSHTLGKT